MNRWFYLFVILACCFCLAGTGIGAQPSDQPENSTDVLSSGSDSYPPADQVLPAGLNRTSQVYQKFATLFEGKGVRAVQSPESGTPENSSSLIPAVDDSGVSTGRKPDGWLTYLEDPRYSIQVPPGWSVYETSTTSENGTIVMFQDNQPSPSFISVMAADNPVLRSFTNEEAGELETNYMYPSFKEGGLRLIPGERSYSTSGQASISHSVIAGDPDRWVISSFLLSDTENFYWVALIGPDLNTYEKRVDIFNEILSSFIPSSSPDASGLWHGENIA